MCKTLFLFKDLFFVFTTIVLRLLKPLLELVNQQSWNLDNTMTMNTID